MLQLSQVIFGVQDLDTATRRFLDLGFEVVDGGHHPGVGTANRVIPVGGSYLELLGVIDEELALESAYGRSLIERTRDGDRLVRWSLRTDHIDDVAARLDLTVEDRSRARPDGIELHWQAAGLELALADPWLPFFMQWRDPEHYPAATKLDHPNGATAVAWLELTPADERLSAWTAGADADLHVVNGVPGLHRVAVATPDGDLVIA